MRVDNKGADIVKCDAALFGARCIDGQKASVRRQVQTVCADVNHAFHRGGIVIAGCGLEKRNLFLTLTPLLFSLLSRLWAWVEHSARLVDPHLPGFDIPKTAGGL